MRSKHANLPKLPAKTYFKLKTDEQIDGRRAALHTYLQEIVNRPDMRTNPIFRSFLEIDEQIPESVSYQPVKQAEITDLQLGARDFCYVESRGFLFVAMSEMNIGNRLDSYITNVSRLSPILIPLSFLLGNFDSWLDFSFGMVLPMG